MADAATAAVEASDLAAELSALSQSEEVQREEVMLLEEALVDAGRAAALALWRRLQVRLL